MHIIDKYGNIRAQQGQSGKYAMWQLGVLENAETRQRQVAWLAFTMLCIHHCEHVVGRCERGLQTSAIPISFAILITPEHCKFFAERVTGPLIPGGSDFS